MATESPNRARTRRPTHSVSAISGTSTIGRLAARKGRFDGTEIDFRFAAAGDAVEKAGGEFFRDQPAPDFGESFFLLGVEDVGGRGEIGVPGIFAGRERLFPGEQQARFSRGAGRPARVTAAFSSSNAERQRAARGGENFADPSFRLRRWGVPEMAGRQATIFCVRVLRWRTDFASGEIAATDECFGGRCFARSRSTRAA